MDQFENQVYVIPLNAWTMEPGVGKLNIVGVLFHFFPPLWVCVGVWARHVSPIRGPGPLIVPAHIGREHPHKRAHTKREDSPM